MKFCCTLWMLYVTRRSFMQQFIMQYFHFWMVFIQKLLCLERCLPNFPSRSQQVWTHSHWEKNYPTFLQMNFKKGNCFWLLGDLIESFVLACSSNSLVASKSCIPVISENTFPLLILALGFIWWCSGFWAALIQLSGISP